MIYAWRAWVEVEADDLDGAEWAVGVVQGEAGRVSTVVRPDEGPPVVREPQPQQS